MKTIQPGDNDPQLENRSRRHCRDRSTGALCSRSFGQCAAINQPDCAATQSGCGYQHGAQHRN